MPHDPGPCLSLLSPRFAAMPDDRAFFASTILRATFACIPVLIGHRIIRSLRATGKELIRASHTGGFQKTAVKTKTQFRVPDGKSYI